jgi:hypothetical protein
VCCNLLILSWVTTATFYQRNVALFAQNLGVRCTAVYPEQIQTSRTSGYMNVLVSGAHGGETKAGYHGAVVWITVSKDGFSKRYEAANYATDAYYAQINLALFPGPGTIHISAYVQDWPYGDSVNCPATNLTRLSYIMGGYIMIQPGLARRRSRGRRPLIWGWDTIIKERRLRREW